MELLFSYIHFNPKRALIASWVAAQGEQSDLLKEGSGPVSFF
jgi:hypothetical protein